MPMSVGNPPLDLVGVVDTSWSPSFVPSAKCTERYCNAHPLYNNSLSSSYRANSTPTALYYSGSAGLYTHGFVSQDSLHIAGLEVKDQVFEEATMWHPDVATRNDVFDTLLGLALWETHDGDGWGNFTAPSAFAGMIRQNLLSENFFTIQFSRTDEERGEITFGGLPHNLSRQDFVEVPLDHSKSENSDHIWRQYTTNGWQIPVNNMSMGVNDDVATIQLLSSPQIAVVSSSFPWILLPEDTAKKANKAIGLKEVFQSVDCSKRWALPNLTLDFAPNHQSISLSPWDYLLEAYDGIDQEVKCVSVFIHLSDYGEKGFILLGAPFLNGLYTVFDAERKSISFRNRPQQ